MRTGQITTGMLNWTTICVGAQAYAYPDTALAFYNKYRGFVGYFDGGASKTNVLYWILTRKFNITGIQQIGSEVPVRYNLYQNYPNPFNPNATIKFDLSKASHVRILIYDAVGRQVDELVNSELKAGTYKAEWNASQFASGVYFYKMISGNFVSAKKMMLIK